MGRARGIRNCTGKQRCQRHWFFNIRVQLTNEDTGGNKARNLGYCEAAIFEESITYVRKKTHIDGQLLQVIRILSMSEPNNRILGDCGALLRLIQGPVRKVIEDFQSS